MPQNVTAWEWTEARLLAVQLVAEDQLTDTQIAELAGIHRKTLHLWKQREEFQAKVAETVTALEAQILSRGIARRSRRVRALDDRWNRMQQVIEERAADTEMEGVPGGKTGLLAHDVKMIGGGESAERIDVYEVDTGLLKELRDHEKQAAQELGQWEEKQVYAGPDGGPLVVMVLGTVSMEDL